MADCCKVVGNFPVPAALSDKCITSINISGSSESQKVDGCFTIGPTTGTLSITGYATNEIHVGCPGRAGVQINWIRKFDCDTPGGRTYFIFSGEGRSSIAGDVGNLARIDLENYIKSYRMISASVGSGPATLYADETQQDGYGLDYVGGPFEIDTTDSDTLTLPDYFEIGTDAYHLQSFSLQCNPGELPTASYSYVFAIQNV